MKRKIILSSIDDSEGKDIVDLIAFDSHIR